MKNPPKKGRNTVNNGLGSTAPVPDDGDGPELMDIINRSRAADGRIRVPDEFAPARDYIVKAMQTIGLLQLQVDAISRTAGAIVSALRNRRKILTCGNGGSAA